MGLTDPSYGEGVCLYSERCEGELEEGCCLACESRLVSHSQLYIEAVWVAHSDPSHIGGGGNVS